MFFIVILWKKRFVQRSFLIVCQLEEIFMAEGGQTGADVKGAHENPNDGIWLREGHKSLVKLIN